MNDKLKNVSIATGAVFAASLAAGAAQAAVGQNPFSVTSLPSGYNLLAEAKCGAAKEAEAKCGADKGAAEAKCGADKAAAEAKCGADKATAQETMDTKIREAKCGEAKCGGAR